MADNSASSIAAHCGNCPLRCTNKKWCDDSSVLQRVQLSWILIFILLTLYYVFGHEKVSVL